jgi:putative ATP-dependent endonuclease of OLD family
VESKFTNNGGTVIAWRDGRALEDELFMSLSNEGIVGLIDRAIEIHGENTINAHIASRSTPNRTASTIRDEAESTGVSSESRQILANAAKIKRSGWFKSVTWMEDVAYDVVSQDLRTADAGFVAILDGLFRWCSSAGP